MHFTHCAIYSCLGLGVTSWWSSHHHEWNTLGNHHRYELLWCTLMTPQNNLRYSLMNSIVPAISALLTLCSMSVSLYSFFGLFCSTSRCTVYSHSHIISQSKVHLHQWWNRKRASFRFSWAMNETCCSLANIPSTFLPPGFLTTLQSHQCSHPWVL